MKRTLVLLLVSLVGSGLASEAGLRVLDRFEPPPPIPVPRQPELYRPDPVLGYTLRPSTRITYHYPVSSTRALSVASNSDGFRNQREFDEPDSRPRIWMLGDSMVLGEGVAAEDRLTEVMERLEPRWRVDNLGMTGWGLDLMVRAFERISRRIQPDLVVLAFYTDDFRRLGPFYSGRGYLFPKFELVGGKLADVPFPAPLPPWRRLRVVQAVEQTYWRFGRNRFDLNEALLNRLHKVTEQGVALAVVFLPGRGDTPEDQRRRTFLRAWCEATRTPFLDLTETLHRVGDKIFIPNNPHWNERGHELAGAAIRDFLRESKLIQ